ncbi:hypothetical protein ACWCP6_26880 [Streptomyces sp. NPDC002004]
MRPSAEPGRRAVVIPVLESRFALEWGCVLVAAGVAAGPALALPLGLLDEPVLFCLAPLVVALALHMGLRGRFVVRFDDAGVTVVRPWRRRHVPWAHIGGMCVQRRRSAADGGDWWKFRLVVNGATGPPLLALDAPDTVGGRLGAAERARFVRHGEVFAELAGRGLGLTGRPAPCDDEVAYVERALREYALRGQDPWGR